MGYLLKQSSTAKPLTFFMVDSSDHISGKTGLSPTVKIGKNGAAGAAPSGAVSEIDSTNLPGWYKVAGNATDSNTLGPLQLHATATGADPCDKEYCVVAFDPDDAAALGLSRVDAAITSRLASGSVTVGTNLDKIGYGLSAAAVQAIWDALTSALTTAGSIGKLLADNINATISSRLASASYTAPDNATISAINAKTTNLPASPAAVSDIPTANANADALLGRNIAGGSSTGRTVTEAFRRLRNRVAIAAGVMTVYQENDTTSAWTASVTTTAGNPVSEVDPT